MAKTPEIWSIHGCDPSGRRVVTTVLQYNPDGSIRTLSNTWENPADEKAFPEAVKKKFNERNEDWQWV